jgi:hypothetical protein
MKPAGDWRAIKTDYVQNPNLTQKDICEKYDLSWDTMRYHAKREKWGEARSQYAQQYAQQLTVASVPKNALPMLREINEKQLKQNEELRYMLNSKLKTRGLDGKISVRPDVTIPDIARAVAAFSELYRLDRLALGASTDNVQPATMGDRLRDMTDEELDAELERVRAKPLLN